MPEPEAPSARSGATQGATYSESASNVASMPASACSLFPKLAFFISLLGKTGGHLRPVQTTLECRCEGTLPAGCIPS